MNHGENVKGKRVPAKKASANGQVQLSAELGKIPPQAVDLEENILGVMMIYSSALEPVMNMIKDSNVFYKEAHQKMYETIRDMYLNKIPITDLSVVQQLKKRGELEFVGGPHYVSSLQNNVVGIGSVEYNCGILLQKFIQRELIRLGTIAVRDSYEDTADSLQLMEDFIKSAEGLREITNFGVNVPYKINGKHIRKENPVVLRMKGVNVLSKGNISVWIAPPGTGKSQLAEIVLAAYLNDTVDVLGFQVSAQKRVALIDTERDRDDAYDGFCRIAKRVGEGLMQADGNFANVDFYSYRTIIKWQDRRLNLRKLIETKLYDFIIVDGYGHFVGNINDPEQAEEFVGELMSYSQVYGCGILGTIHNNFKSGSSKGQEARGHLGGALMREAQSYYALVRDKEDKSLRVLTSRVGDNVKNRSGSDEVEIAFRWSDEHNMFVGVDDNGETLRKMNNPYDSDTEKRPRQSVDLYMTVVRIFAKKHRLRSADFVKELMRVLEIKESRAESHKATCIRMEYVRKDEGGYFVINDPHKEDLPF